MAQGVKLLLMEDLSRFQLIILIIPYFGIPLISNIKEKILFPIKLQVDTQNEVICKMKRTKME